MDNTTLDLTARFYTAQDSRRAINALERLGIDVEGPTPVRPIDGRPWQIEALVPTDGMTQRYPRPVLLDKFDTVVLQCNGSTQKV